MDKKMVFLIFLQASFALINSGLVIGQNRHEVDSIKAINIVETKKENIVDNLNNLADLYSDSNIDSAHFFANKALETSLQIGYKYGEAEAYFLLSYFHDRDGKLNKAIEYQEKAIKIYTELGDSSYLVGCYNNLGVLYSYGTDQKTSLEYFIKAMNLAENLHETFALSEAYSNIGSFYEYLKEYGSALKYYNKALEVDLKMNNLHNIALSYITVGSINIKLQRFENARDSLKKAEKLIKQVKDNYRKTELFINLADYYIETNQFDSAYNHILLAKKINRNNNYDRLNADILSLEGDLLFKQKKYRECLPLYDKAIEIYNKLQVHDNLYDIYINKSTACSQLGKHDKAYEILQLAQKLNDDFKPNEIARILGDFEHSETLKEEKAKLRLEQEIQFQKNKNEIILIRAKLHGAVVSIVFLIIVIALVIYFYIEKRKHNSLLEQNFKTIQEQKTLLEENFVNLKNNEKKLSQLNATKDKFFSIIAHDLKNPFSVLIGLSDIVISDPDVRNSEEFEQIIDGIFQTAKSGYSLLENLLEWARSQTGDLEYKPELVNINEIITSNISLFKETAKAKKIEIRNLISTEQNVYADYNMVNFIVRNLMNNAIKFSFQNSKIDIKEQQKDGFHTFTIQDYGVGMKKELLEKLFKIESTNPKPGTANEMGTGLGLIICKEFVEKNGGEIWVESEEGNGSSFHFSLPDDNEKRSDT
jgi:signal transduction histidine kinase